nr:synaptobrevin, longin-like domain protein [Tanacetum cinerariifolium]
MVAILESSEHNVDFHPIVDFVEASPLDGILRTITESSLRRNLKLKDEEGISSLPNAELFETLTLMGYNISPNQKFTFQNGQFSHQWKYLIHTIMQCLSPKSTGFNEFSSNIATALICLATNRTYNFSKMIFDGMVKNVNNKGEGSSKSTDPHHTPSPEAQDTSYTTHSSPTLSPVTTAPIPTVTLSDTPTLRQYTRRARIAQSSAFPPVADESASPLRDVSKGKACPTNSGFGADQDRANIAKTSTLPHDSAPKVTSPAADEGRGAAERSGDDAPIKGRNLDEGEAAAERVTTVLASKVVEVPTGSGSIPTAGPPAAEVSTSSDVVPTASPFFATATVIDAQVARELEEQMEREDQRMSEQIAREAEIARIHAEKELQIMIDRLNKEIHSLRSKRGITTWQSSKLEDFIPIGSKEEAERFKRKGIRFEQESVKKLKTSEEVPEEVKTPNEVLEEKVKEMMQLVPINEYLDREDLNQLWALVKESLNIRPASIEWKLCESCGVHHVTSKDNEIFMLIEKDYPLRKGLEIVMICYKFQVENYSQIANDLILKIYKIANCPSQKDD